MNAPSAERTTVSIQLLERSYQVSCTPAERALLLASAELVSGKMQQIRDRGKVVGLERILAMTALNLAEELLHQQQAAAGSEGLDRRMEALHEKVLHAMEGPAP